MQVGKFGILVSHGMSLAPGHHGRLQFCLFNAGARRFELRSGMRIVGLEIMPLTALPSTAGKGAAISIPENNFDVIAHFGGDNCNRLIRDALRAYVKVTPLAAPTDEAYRRKSRSLRSISWNGRRRPRRPAP
jgi:hypothetical protein